jgi:NAD(P)-dependent dehydrogenase (short-subunit alcohol dehydrogenase family)
LAPPLNDQFGSAFLLGQAFAHIIQLKGNIQIVNLLDWRAQHPGFDQLPYTISNIALAALIPSLAVALSPDVTINGLSLGAVLPTFSSDGREVDDFLAEIPAHRSADMGEVSKRKLFLLHLSLLLCTSGYLLSNQFNRQRGGLLNEAAILMFLGATIYFLLRARN